MQAGCRGIGRWIDALAESVVMQVARKCTSRWPWLDLTLVLG